MKDKFGDKKIRIKKLGISLVSILGLNLAYAAPNVIGFFQSYDQSNPAIWVFNGAGESIDGSGYTVLIDAFWVNYPFCWGDGSCTAGKGNPIKECCGISNQPGPGLSNTIDSDFWNNFNGSPAPSQAGDAYTTFWTSLHTPGPQTISNLRTAIDNSSSKPKLLASIGGWLMGGSGAGQPGVFQGS